MLKKFHTGEGVMSTPLPTCVHKLPAVQPRGLKTGLAKNAGLHGLMLTGFVWGRASLARPQAEVHWELPEGGHRRTPARLL